MGADTNRHYSGGSFHLPDGTHYPPFFREQLLESCGDISKEQNPQRGAQQINRVQHFNQSTNHSTFKCAGFPSWLRLLVGLIQWPPLLFKVACIFIKAFESPRSLVDTHHASNSKQCQYECYEEQDKATSKVCEVSKTVMMIVELAMAHSTAEVASKK
jgi:hypothetical protein